MKSIETPSLAPLRALLHDAATSPAAAAEALANERMRLVGSGALAQELLAVELRWLATQRSAFGSELDDEFATARRDWLQARVRLLAMSKADAAVLCELAEVQASAAIAGEPELGRQCAEAIAAGVARVVPGPVVDQEVAERFALLSTAIDDLPIDHQVQLLGCTGRVVRSLAASTASSTCRRLGRRLLRASDDRELARRLEARIGARGVAFIETTNFVLLLVVLTTLVIESTATVSDSTLHVLHWIDALACVFFVADFAFELALHPSRWSWFLRNAVTDLLPSVLFLLPGVDVLGIADSALALRVLRLMRVTWAARYVQALRPLLRSARLLLFLVRGLDGLAARFQQILNREFVFVPGSADVRRTVIDEDLRDLLFAALRREHELVGLLPNSERLLVLQTRAVRVRTMAQAMLADGAVRRVATVQARDIPIGEAIEFLWALRPQDIGRWLRPADLQSLDRVVRVLSAPPVRWLPIIRRVAVHPLPASPEERIVELGRRIAEWCESWHGRMLFFADLHGIVTGPQILDRVATAMVKATQRPAVRLILFGGVFSLFGGSTFSKPLYILGGVCLLLLLLGHWLKRLAGEASEAYRLTSEAHFLSQLERIKSRYEREDLAFLTKRIFGDGVHAVQAQQMLRLQVASARTGVPIADKDVPEWVRLEANRTALLYLHFLDGAPLHLGDVKTTEQLLANQSLENLRQQFLGSDKKDRKRLRKLKLDEGSILGGPYLWFRFITESIAVESAKRIGGYNRYCIPLAERAVATPAALAAMQDWLQRRRDPRGGRTLRETPHGAAPTYPAAEFTALDFVGGDSERDHHIATLFGAEVLAVVRADRRTMVREIFGTRPVHNLPKHERSFNPMRFYRRRLSHGRVLLAPLLLLWRFLRSVGWLVGRVRQIVREVFDPELAMQRREIGEAPFAVALRKIHRMKAPGLLEAIRMRLAVDPVYAGAPVGWSQGEPFADESPVERDLLFLHLREREAVRLRDAAVAVRAQIAGLHAALAWLPSLGEGADADACAAGEFAVSCAWVADQHDARTLLFAERWRTDVLPRLQREGERPSWASRAWRIVRSAFTVHPVDRWLERHGQGLTGDAIAAVHSAYAQDLHGTRSLLDAWRRLPAGASPAEHAIATLRAAYRQGGAVRRDVMALRAVQSLAVLDIRNYRDLVFALGDYGSDGEDAALGGALP